MDFQKNKSLKGLNTFGVDISCSLFCQVNSISQIKNLLSTKEFKEKKHLILGEGSNILFVNDFDGLIIKNEIKGISIIDDNEETVLLKVGAAENWHQFVKWTINQGYSGLENLSLIPGNVGTSPIQNIGAYGKEVKDSITKVEGIFLNNGEIFSYKNSECNFNYRESIFKNKLKGNIIINYVTFRLSKTEKHNILYGEVSEELKKLNLEISTKNISNVIMKIRKRKLPNPKIIGNCGSFFKNPIISSNKFKDLQKKFPKIIGYSLSEEKIKIAAGWIIDQCGWKGYRKGDVGVHEHQALVLVNYGNSSGREIISLAQEIQKSVLDKFDIEILPEVNIIE